MFARQLVKSELSLSQWPSPPFAQPVIPRHSVTSTAPVDGNFALFTCQRCGKVYQQLRSLHRHQKYECHQKPKFSCNFCSLQTKHRSSLVIHMKRKHNMGLSNFLSN
ncbi:hypothetical protein FOCC_FOCC005502 [Frankliniella occidentalis]|nr:hypothetical protein FOCC_FOCC005502 [Frankliniella occidentalis]